MSKFAVRVVEITTPIEHHPNADRLSIIRIGGYICISAKVETEDGSLGHRYKVGDKVIYVPEGAVVPEFILRRGFWNQKLDIGGLAGPQGNRVKAMMLRGIFSQGLLLPVEGGIYPLDDGTPIGCEIGEDISEALGIYKYEPEIPDDLLGEVFSIHGHTSSYDFGSIQEFPDLFEAGEPVIVTEKIHGVNTQIGYLPDFSDNRLFGEGKRTYVSSKGLAQKGLVFINSEDNDGNLYIRVMKTLLGEGLEERMGVVSKRYGNARVLLFGEIFGLGVQDLRYGQNGHSFAAFDIKVGDHFLPYDERISVLEELGIKSTPLLYGGPFDLDAIKQHRDGEDSISGTNVREGVVIISRTETRHVLLGRKIGKWVSPNYLLRKGGTEYQ